MAKNVEGDHGHLAEASGITAEIYLAPGLANSTKWSNTPRGALRRAPETGAGLDRASDEAMGTRLAAAD